MPRPRRSGNPLVRAPREHPALIGSPDRFARGADPPSPFDNGGGGWGGAARATGVEIDGNGRRACRKRRGGATLTAVSAQSASMPLRLLLAVLLVASSLWTGPLPVRRERSDTKSSIATRAAVLRPPAGRGVPDQAPLSAALPSEGPSLPTPRIAAAPDLAPAGGLAPARPGTRAPSARAPPLPA